MEALIFLIAFYGGIVLIGWIFGQIGKWIENNNRKIRNEATDDSLKEHNFNFENIEKYKSKLKEIGYEENNNENFYYNYVLTDGSRKLAGMLGKCPACNKGDLIIRKGQYGKFIGCTAYPSCKYTDNLKEAKEEYQKKSGKEFLSKLDLAYQ